MDNGRRRWHRGVPGYLVGLARIVERPNLVANDEHRIVRLPKPTTADEGRARRSRGGGRCGAGAASKKGCERVRTGGLFRCSPRQSRRERSQSIAAAAVAIPCSACHRPQLRPPASAQPAPGVPPSYARTPNRKRWRGPRAVAPHPTGFRRRWLELAPHPPVRCGVETHDMSCLLCLSSRKTLDTGLLSTRRSIRRSGCGRSSSDRPTTRGDPQGPRGADIAPTLHTDIDPPPRARP